MIRLIISIGALLQSFQSFSSEKVFFSMGSPLSIKVNDQWVKEAQLESFFHRGAKDLIGFEARISTWQKQSELSRFNTTVNQWRKLNKKTYLAIKEAMNCSVLTKGYFNPALGKLIQSWGLRQKIKVPSNQEIVEGVKSSSLDFLKLNDKDFSIMKTSKEMWIEEGGFAKGAALDHLLELAQKSHIKNFSFNFSGQIYSSQKDEINIAHPDDRFSASLGVMVEGESVSTSSIGLNFFEHKGQVYGHVLNPFTGSPLSHKYKSVTVIHANNLMADCLSTGLLAMSDNKNHFNDWVLSHPDIKFIVQEKEGENIKIFHSCNLKNKIQIKSTNSSITNTCSKEVRMKI